MKTSLKIFYLLPVFIVMGIVAYMGWTQYGAPPKHVMSGKPFATTPIGGLTANFFTPAGALTAAGSDVFIEFRDSAGKLVDVGDAQFELSLSVPTEVRHEIFKIMRTSTPGQYRATIIPQIVGDWNARLEFTGPHGSAETNLVVTVK